MLVMAPHLGQEPEALAVERCDLAAA